MKSIVLNPTTKNQIKIFKSHPSHFLIVEGPSGIGKGTLAREIATDILGLRSTDIDRNPYVLIIQPDKSSISIDAIRELKRFLRLKTSGDNLIRRAVIIEEGQYLTLEAQNALLKTLEEPPEDSLIFLTVNRLDALQPTIRSRAQILTPRKPSKADVIQHFTPPIKNSAIVEQAFRLSDGLPGLMSSILNPDSDHPLISAVESVKKTLKINRFERLLLVTELSKDREKTKEFVEALVRISNASLIQASQSHKIDNIKLWRNILDASLGAQRALSINANVRLVLTNMFLSF